MIGSTLSHFRITAKLGAGGMGEVYRAEDGRLGRQVAIKVLPAAFVADADRLARFEREARTLASLSHPNIASIYEVGHENGTHFLVMELVPGETLADRISRGRLPLDEALPIALQIAEALEVAHERGIVHRDLKPANVMVDAGGRVKVLDFGLAKALAEGEGANAELADSPTLTKYASAAGVLLGTAGYMSPEQARGRPVDRRSDIWALGVVLLEMLTGEQLFKGVTVQDTLAAVLTRSIELGDLPAEVPAPMRRALSGCLARDPRERWRHAGDVALLLRAPELPPRGVAPARRHVAWAAAALALGVAAGSGITWLALGRGNGAQPGSELRKLEVTRVSVERTGPVLSPDGKWVAYVDKQALWIRSLDRLDAQRVPESDFTSAPIWSPDSRWLAFPARRRLLKLPVEGGPPQVIANLPHAADGNAAGGGWGTDGTIIFTTGYSDLLAVSASGGDIRTLLERTPEESDYHNPHLLPGGRGVVFAIHLRGRPEMPLAVFRDGRKEILRGLPGPQRSDPRYDDSGHLLFRRGPAAPGIWAVPFSLETLKPTGEASLVVAGADKPSIDRHGNLLYRERLPQLRELVRVDRAGVVVETLGEPMEWMASPQPSPDGRRVAFVATDGQGTDIWVRDLARGTTSRLTFTPEEETTVQWSRAGDRLAFDTEGAERMLHVIEVDGGTPATTVGPGSRPAWGPDGTLVYEVFGARGIWQWRQGGEPSQVLDYDEDESAPHLSPDGRFMVLLAQLSGSVEVYVTRFPSGEGRWQVSRGAAFVGPVWSPQGDEIFYVDEAGRMMAAPVQTTPELAIGAPRPLFDTAHLMGDYALSQAATFGVAADGRSFLSTRPAPAETQGFRLVHVQGWVRELRSSR